MRQGLSGGFCWVLLVLLFLVGVAREFPFGGSITPPDWLEVDVCALFAGWMAASTRHVSIALRKNISHL
ncbi:MAG: hypothetical protein ACK55I_20540, partial [bacterium]